jgi:lysozyme
LNIERVQKQLEIDEGVKYEIYEDHLGYPTFGIGHLVLKSDEEFGMPIGSVVTHERVNASFKHDLAVAIDECSILYNTWNCFPEEVQEILVNMMFNLGRPRLSKFKNFKAALEAKQWELAASEGRNSLWYRQVGNRAERLMTRLGNVV